ncbi:RDD family protein [Microlunatus sp. GCM10028923]|uniref:RDD family protein n=1 Tax=Microlunatus sp. GCM10028923 TaxID=3273400 RepID=UPI00360DB6B9
MESPQPVPAPGTGLPPGVQPGDVGKRVAAYLIEWAAPGIVVWLLSLIGVLAQSAVLSLVLGIVSFIALIGWVVFVWWSYVSQAAGPGMKLMGLQLVGYSDGRPLSWGRVILRWLLLGVIAGTGIGAILLLVFMLQNPRRQTWPDQIADAVVIQARPLAPKQLPQDHQQQYAPGPAGPGDRGLFPQQPEHGVQTPVRYGHTDRYGRDQYGQQSQQSPYPEQGQDQYQQAGQDQYGQQQGQYRQDQYPQDQYGQDQYQQDQYAQQQGQYPQQDQYGQPQDAYPQEQYGQDQYGQQQDQYAQPDQYGQQQDAYQQGYGDQYQDQFGQDQGYDSGPAVAAPIPGATQFPAAAPPPVSGSSAGSADYRDADPRPLNQGWRASLDDGREIAVNGLVLLGRNPQARPNEDDAQLIKISDETRTVSKTHLALGVDAGGMYVMDRGSTNGSTATDSEGQTRPCAPGDVVQVDAGTIVSFGDHWLEVKRP